MERNYHKDPIEHYFHASTKALHYHEKQTDLHKTHHKIDEENHIKKLKKSGSCNYLKGSQYISDENVM